MAQSNATNDMRRGRTASTLYATARNRGLLLVGALVLSMIGAAIYIAVSMVNSRYDDLRRNVERDLLARAQEQVSTFTLWYGTTTNRMQNLADSDFLRLLAVEMKSVEALPDDEGKAESIQSIRKVLLDTVNQSNLLGVTLLDAALTPYVSSLEHLPELSDAQKSALAVVRENGRSLALPATLVEQAAQSEFAFDFLVPIFPPAYVMSASTEPVGYVLATCNMTDIVTRISASESAGAASSSEAAFSSRLLQRANDHLVAFVPPVGNKPAAFSSWPGVPHTATTFAPVSRPDGVNAYTLTIPMTSTPWYMECDVERRATLEAYESYRIQVALVVAGCLGVVLLCLGVIWWLLVGQREKAVAAELHGLYATINAQSQLLDNVNSAVNDGIVLMDRGNTIHYVNQAFTRMVGMERGTLIGQTFARALSTHTNLPINPHVAGVLHEGKSATFTEELAHDGATCIYQVGCSPYRNARGAIEGVVSVYRDITSMLEAERYNAHVTSQMIQVLVRGIEVFDPYLSGQTMFTATLAQTLGHHLDLDEKHLTTLRIAALLSKVGMIKVPAELRTKEVAYTPEERKIVEKHVEYTSDLLADIDFGVPVQQAIYQMYESMDGTGYPQKLRGEAIMLDARILAVANTFCAVMRPRAYRGARSLGEALEILASPRYDARIVEVLRLYLRTVDGAAFNSELVGNI